MNKCLSVFFLFVLAFSCAFGQQKRNKNLVIHFNYIANGKPLIADSNYSNALGETYSLSKFKFYISNISMGNKQSKAIFLVDAFANDSIILPFYATSKGLLSFQIGVDSIYNCSGAQSGALDPLNGMFWTWNTGYINFKIEGSSEFSSTASKNIEYHIGGYKGENKTMRTIQLPFSLSKNNHEIYILVNMDRFWNGVSDLKISATPVITTPGSQAKAAADNFSKVFSIIQK